MRKLLDEFTYSPLDSVPVMTLHAKNYEIHDLTKPTQNGDSNMGIPENGLADLQNEQNNKSAKTETDFRKTVLVVGDSFIDENWQMADYDLSRSYNVGDTHLISSQKDTGLPVTSFSGVADIMKLLWEGSVTQKNDKGKYDIFGLTALNPGDRPLLERMLCPEFQGKNVDSPFVMRGIDVPGPGKRCSFCSSNEKNSSSNKDDTPPPCRVAGHLFNSIKDNANANRITSTNRIVRIYKGHRASELKLVSRLDWVLPIDESAKDKEVVEKLTKEIPTGIGDQLKIVLVDHGYGCVDESLVAKLIETYPNARWFIRTKVSNPGWLSKFRPTAPEGKSPVIQLMFTDQQHVEGNFGVRTWHHEAGGLGRGSLEVIGDLMGLTCFEHTMPVHKKTAVKAENAAFLLDDNTAIAGSRNRQKMLIDSDDPTLFDDADVFGLFDKPEPTQPIRVGRSTVFFASLVYWDLVRTKSGLSAESMKDACQFAVKNAYEWTKSCTEKWTKSELIGDFKTAIPQDSQIQASDANKASNIEDIPKTPKVVSYLGEWRKWNQSSTDLGVVGETVPRADAANYGAIIEPPVAADTTSVDLKTDNNNADSKVPKAPDAPDAQGVVKQNAVKQKPDAPKEKPKPFSDCMIELWRAEGTLKDYICPGGQKRTDINELVTRLEHYQKQKDRKYPFNTLLLAEPGWGKSYLAQCIAKHFKFEYLSFSVAQMASNRELVESFKSISSVQNRSQKQLLVFVDEVDALVENHNALGLMLGPIWDGTFASDGNIYKINPCVWFFASSTQYDELRKLPKAKDFLSRINGPIIYMGLSPDARKNGGGRMADVDTRKLDAFVGASGPDNQGIRTELVYHGLNFLNRTYGPINEISVGVLRLLYDTVPLDGVRSMEIFVSRFHNITKGIVTLQNRPDLKKCPELERHIVVMNPNSWNATEEPPIMIKVVTKP